VGLDGSDDVEVVVIVDLLVGVWECVVIGGGICGDFELFECVVNFVYWYVFGVVIVFNIMFFDIFDVVVCWIMVFGDC